MKREYEARELAQILGSMVEGPAGDPERAAIVALSPASDATYGNADRNRAEFFKALVKSIGEGK